MDGFIMKNPIKMDDLGVPLFSETSKMKPYLKGDIYILQKHHFLVSMLDVWGGGGTLPETM